MDKVGELWAAFDDSGDCYEFMIIVRTRKVTDKLWFHDGLISLRNGRVFFDTEAEDSGEPWGPPRRALVKIP